MGYSPKSFFIFSITSLDWLTASLAMVSSCSPRPTRLTRLTYSLEHLGQSGRGIEFLFLVFPKRNQSGLDFRSQSTAWQTAILSATPKEPG